MPLMDVMRRLIASLIIASFLVFVCFQGLEWNAKRSGLTFGTANKPDFSNYVFNRTLGEDELALKAGHRAIFVGDIHGQSLALEALLAKLEYDEGKDTLVHTGDIVAKGTLDGSRTVLAFMASHSIHGVRGNHDQKVIEWRAWIEWIRPMEGGAGGRWLDRLEDDLAAHVGDEVDAEEWVEAMKKKGKRRDKKWWDRVPKEWKLLGDHYRIASSMTPEQYTYLKKLPLALHLPSEHAFVVHAGLLPYDLERPMLADGQPLGHAPEESIGDVAARRASQERAVLSDIAQNREPWNVLNMRNVLHDHTVTKDTDRGKSWMSVWNTIMPKCAGFTPPANHDVEHDKWLPCQPMSVIYGHTASRGLDMHRWTLGIDSGCVYGRRLTGLVLQSASRQAGTEMSMRRASDASEDKAAQEDAKAQQHEVVKFGDSGKARIVSVKCHMHKEHKGTGELPDRI